ncbi:MAG: translation elongation factor Ts [Deltaproteobacteria bacterium]|nr:translation elongation factor Ts [Deltaproteobacteria bacterium]
MGVKAESVKELRAATGAGILDCKTALEESGGDFDKAVEYLKKKNRATAVKKQSRDAKEGQVSTYVHGDGRIGVMIEINSETDFVARSDPFTEFTREMCLQVAAMAPLAVDHDDLDPEMVAKQKEIFEAQMEGQKKPPEIIEKIITGKLNKWYKEVCLLDQAYIRDDSKSVRDLLTEVIGKCGENIRVRRFARYELGEGL